MQSQAAWLMSASFTPGIVHSYLDESCCVSSTNGMLDNKQHEECTQTLHASRAGVEIIITSKVFPICIIQQILSCYGEAFIPYHVIVWILMTVRPLRLLS